MADLYEMQRLNPTAPSARHVAALNRTLVKGGTPTAGLSGPNVVNEYAAQMRVKSPELGGARELNRDIRRQFRNMSPVQRAQYVDQQVVQNEAAMGAAQHRVSLRNPIGATMDEQHDVDREYYAPGTRAVLEEARRKFKGEFATLMTGANKQAWATAEDYEGAVNGLESVRKYGPMIENYVQQLARAHTSPAMQAQFEATDANIKSYVQFQQKNGDTRPADEIADDFDDPKAREAWEADIGAVKYDPSPNGKGIVQRQPTPQQQASATLQFQMDADIAQVQAMGEQTDRWLAGDPERAKFYMKGPDGKPMPKPTPAPDMQTEAAQSAARKRVQREADIAAGNIEPAAAEQAPEERAAELQAAGEPIPVNPRTGKPVLPDKDATLYKALTEEVWMFDGKVIDKEVPGAVRGRRVKPQFKEFGAEPAVPAQADLEKKLNRKLTAEEIQYLKSRAAK